MGLSGNLTTGEILEQIVHADRILAQEWQDLGSSRNTTSDEKDDSMPKVDLIRNVVFMGMGEPLDNYNNVVDACRSLIDKKRWSKYIHTYECITLLFLYLEHVNEKQYIYTLLTCYLYCCCC